MCIRDRYYRSRTRPIEFRHAWAILALSFMGLAAPLTTLAQPSPGTQRTWNVKVEALGRKNARAQGDEVWIYEIRTPTEVLEWKNALQFGPRWDLAPQRSAAGGARRAGDRGNASGVACGTARRIAVDQAGQTQVERSRSHYGEWGNAHVGPLLLSLIHISEP